MTTKRRNTAWVGTVMAVLLAPDLAAAQPCGVDMAAVEKRIAELEKTYSLVLSDIGCDVNTNKARQLMCDDDMVNTLSNLWSMGRLDDLAWAYAYENATKTRTDRIHPPRDAGFIKRRDACTTAACLCAELREHTNDSLGRTSPYAKP